MAMPTTPPRLGAVTAGGDAGADEEGADDVEEDVPDEEDDEDDEDEEVEELLDVEVGKAGAVAAAGARPRASRASSACRRASSTFIRWISERIDETSCRRSESCCSIDCFWAARSATSCSARARAR